MLEHLIIPLWCDRSSLAKNFGKSLDRQHLNTTSLSNLITGWIMKRQHYFSNTNNNIEHKYSLGPETGTLETVAVGCTTLATLLIIGLAVELSSKGSKCYWISSLNKRIIKHILYLTQPSHSYPSQVVVEHHSVVVLFVCAAFRSQPLVDLFLILDP